MTVKISIYNYTFSFYTIPYRNMSTPKPYIKELASSSNFKGNVTISFANGVSPTQFREDIYRIRGEVPPPIPEGKPCPVCEIDVCPFDKDVCSDDCNIVWVSGFAGNGFFDRLCRKWVPQFRSGTFTKECKSSNGESKLVSFHYSMFPRAFLTLCSIKSEPVTDGPACAICETRCCTRNRDKTYNNTCSPACQTVWETGTADKAYYDSLQHRT